MKVCFKNVGNSNFSDKLDVLKDFSQYLQSELKLDKEVHIHFVNDRKIPMTTGVRMPHHEIHVLNKGRLPIDILRTIAHEWVHEFQHQRLGLKDDDEIQDIGGPEENMASVLTSIFIKKFQNNFPQHKKIIYEE